MESTANPSCASSRREARNSVRLPLSHAPP